MTQETENRSSSPSLFIMFVFILGIGLTGTLVYHALVRLTGFVSENGTPSFGLMFLSCPIACAIWAIPGKLWNRRRQRKATAKS